MKYYCIQDLDTKEYYRDTLRLNLEPTVHTYGKGWDKPLPDRWTLKLDEAVQFPTYDDALEFVNLGLKRCGMEGRCINWVEFIDKVVKKYDMSKKLIVLEYDMAHGIYFKSS